MTVDLSPLAAVLLPLVQAALFAAVPPLLVWLRQHLALMQDVTLSRAITDCVGRGAGLTYQMLAAVAHGVRYVMQSVPDALKRLGVTPDHVGAMVTAELGKLLAIDPSVSIAPPVAPAAAPALAAFQKLSDGLSAESGPATLTGAVYDVLAACNAILVACRPVRCHRT